MVQVSADIPTLLLGARLHAFAAKSHLIAGALRITDEHIADVATRLGHDLSALADELTSDPDPPRQVGDG